MIGKPLIVGIIIFSLALIGGSYFLLAPSEKKQAVQRTSYSLQDAEKPKVKTEDTFFNLGEMKVSQQKEAIFSLKNSGSKPLQLFNISSSCDCTVGQIVYEGKESQEFGMHAAGDYALEILPQKEAKVKVIYRPYVMPVYGKVEREVYVSTNDPENPKLVFKVEAFVK